jgi:stearoyl-CoA desaturase (delta-9 desaturase)
MHSASSASASSSRQPIPVPAALERVVTLDGADLAEAAVAPTIVETGSDIDLTDPDLTDLDRNPEIETRLAPLHIRIINFVAVVLPFLGLVAAMVLLWGTAFSWVYLAMLVGGTILTGLGVTVGYHRLFTHRSFRTVRPVELGLAVLGSMAVQGPVVEWVATHRKHHQHSDGEADPHSPHGHDDTLFGFIRGFIHAHVGWLFDRKADDIDRYATDLYRDKGLVRTSNLFVLWVTLGLLIPAAIGGLVTMTWMGVLLGFLWGGLARVFVLHHITWSVNSVCHIWGAKHFASSDESRNNPVFGILTFGEGWHNNHHAFPTSARHGLLWWQFDLSYIVIRALGLLGLAKDIKLPTPERMKAKRRH